MFFAFGNWRNLQTQMAARLHPHPDQLSKLTEDLLLEQRVLLLNPAFVV